MLSYAVIDDKVHWQKGYAPVAQAKGESGRQIATLREEVYRLEVTDRELLYGDSFLSEWGRMSNYSPDDFE